MDRAEGALRVAEHGLREIGVLRSELTKFSNAKPITSLYLDDDGVLVAVLADGSVRPIGNLRGPPGPKGMDGKDGLSIKGDAGEQGPMGATGPAGADGRDGVGVAGERGEPGPPGEPGARGQKGEAGESGAAGERGEPGTDGLPGTRGERGEKGHDGKDGKEGQKGEKGSQGEQGIRGEQGPRGEEGAQGPQGKLAAVKAYEEGAVYYQGDVVVHDGSTFQALRDTGRNVSHADWACLARAGRNGADGLTPTVRETYDLNERYCRLDIVALDGAAFIARRDDPGICPGDGWQLMSKQGKPGRRGEDGARGLRGEAGPKGDPGEPAATIKSWIVDRERYRASPLMSDGTVGPILELRGFFERYHDEAGE